MYGGLIRQDDTSPSGAKRVSIFGRFDLTTTAQVTEEENVSIAITEPVMSFNAGKAFLIDIKIT